MYRFVALLLFIAMTIVGAKAQILQVSPYFPTVNDSITIIYDATTGNGALAGVGTVYAHTGLITSQSVDNTDWKNTQGNWGTADNHVLMTNLSNNKFQISFKISSFYGITATDTVKELVFVFRNTDGTIVGRNDNGDNIVVPLYDDSLHVGFINQAHVQYAALNGTVNLFGAASRSCALQLTQNGNILAQVNSDTLRYNNFHLFNYGQTVFNLTGTDGSHTDLDSLVVFVNPTQTVQNAPVGTKDGINYLDDSTVILYLTAPYKNFVYVIGDFNNWQVDTSYLMKKTTDGIHYWLQISHLIPQKEYIFQYLVDGAIRVGDPYADKVSDPYNDGSISLAVFPNLIQYPTGKTTGVASVLQTAQQPYVWHDSSYTKPPKNNLIVYELLVRDFVAKHSWSVLTDSIEYLHRLGINTIELMPIMNFESNNSWGYNPNYFFAPHKYYGPKDSLKMFIDSCHRMGIAVVLDIALNDAFGTNPWVMMYWDSINQRPAANNPWFNQVATHPYSVGYDLNHESSYTKDFVHNVTRYWVREYHADGYRFDLTKGYTQFYSGTDVGLWGQYDASRVNILESMVDSIWSVYPNTFCIFEELAQNSEETELSNHGILLWGNLNDSYNQATMGYNSNWDFTWGSYQARGWSSPNLVTYMESHDEERLMYKNLTYGNVNGGYSVKDLPTALKRQEMAGTLFFPIPGPKMIWQFGELGYDVSIDQDCRICPKPIRWYYEQDPNRAHLLKVWTALIHLKRDYAPFSTTNFTTNLGGSVKTINLNHSDFDVLALGNFDMSQQSAVPGFQHTGWWYDYFNNDSINITSTSQSYNYQAGEYHLYTDKKLPAFVDTTTVGINPINASNTTEPLVFPNPTTGLVQFAVSLKNNTEVGLTIFDINGKQLFNSKENLQAGQQTLSINLNENQSITTGMYFYRITIDGQPYNGKLGYFKP